MAFETQLAQIKSLLNTFILTGDRLLDGSLDVLAENSGKMLRPQLYLMSCALTKTKPDLKVATGLELLHIGTLVHDDVIDEAKLRRGKPSIQSQYGKEYAVYMGDYLFSSLFVLLSDSTLKRKDQTDLAKVMNEICVAEMKQYRTRYDVTLRERDYLGIISGKTAALFSLSMALGSSESLRPKLAKIGYLLGMAFQLQDDALDFSGDQEVVGKDLQKDLVMGYYHMPVIYSLQSNPLTKLALQAEPTDVENIVRLVKSDGSVKKTNDMTDSYFEKCLALCTELPQSPEKQQLFELIRTIRQRIH